MNKTSLKKILDHPDRDEIISKLVIGISPKDIHEWLTNKYVNVSETKFVISEKVVKSFQDNYLDIYTVIKEDFAKAKSSLANSTEEQLELSIKDNPTYKNLVLQTVGKELDLKQSISQLCVAVETRLAQIYDYIQENPRDVNTRIDRILIEYVDKLGGLLEKAYKIMNNGPDQVVQHNITVQHMDQYVFVIYEAIKLTLEQMDIESSIYFMERFNENINKIQDPNNKVIRPVEERLAEVKALNEAINQKING